MPNPSPTEADPRRSRRWLANGIRLAATAAVTWFVLDRFGVQWSDAQALSWDDWSPRPGPVAASVVLLVVAFLSSAWIWARIVADLGGPSLPLREAGSIVFVSNLGRYVPGKVWQIAGMAWLARERGVSPGMATLAALVGTGLTVAAAAIVGAPAFLGAGGGTGTALIVFPLVAGVAILVTPAIFRRGVDAVLRLARERVELAPGNLHGAGWLSLYVVNWVGYAAAFGLFAVGSGVQLSFLAAGSAFAAAYVVGYVAFFAPAGAGVREAGLVALLAGALPPGDALALAVAGRIWITGVELAIALIFFIGMSSSRRGRGGVGEAAD